MGIFIGIFYLIILLSVKLCICIKDCEILISEGNIDSGSKEIKKCCNQVTAALLTREVCLNRSLDATNRQNIELKEEFLAFNNECDALLKDSPPENSWKNQENFMNCKEMNFTERKLQIRSGFSSHIRLPTMSSSLRGPQETQESVEFKFQAKKICVSVLSLHYIKVCEKVCDVRTASTVTEDVFPRSCFPICVDFARHVCTRGCSLFGCNITSEECIYQMCNFRLEKLL
ncbi:hypothetical protein OJ253_1926 [Cryptosporidium canis]|uniref:Uncharacterized protein n=1 Tax=Cryptosporidium canis TaxID=195482 RepID=A0A9D5DG71_9CRYT|nr:hypothetical protein OJ253_1926 [Cryptosporidium canis]